MSILRKKLEVKPGVPDYIKNNLTIWRPLHLAICEAFSELTQLPWETGTVKVRIGELKELQSDLPETGLCFSYGESGEVGTLLAHFESRFAAQVTTRSLEMQASSIDESYLLSILDLILFKPVIQSFDTELGDLFSAIYDKSEDSFRQLERALKLEDVGLAKDVGPWNEVTLLIQKVEDELSKADKAKVKKKAGVKKPMEPLSLAYRILLPQFLLQHLLASHVNEAGSPVVDPENPWTKHLRQSLSTAIVPVRAVVETCRMTVADCTRFEIGQVIDLPGVSLQSIGLETEMIEGSVNFGSAALGIYKSHRAVKLTDNMKPEFLSDSFII